MNLSKTKMHSQRREQERKRAKMRVKEQKRAKMLKLIKIKMNSHRKKQEQKRRKMAKHNKTNRSRQCVSKAEWKANHSRITKRLKKKPLNKGSSINGAQRRLRLSFTKRGN